MNDKISNSNEFNGSINSKITKYRDFVIKTFDIENDKEKYRRELNFYLTCAKEKSAFVPSLMGYSADECWIKIENIKGTKVSKFEGFFYNSLISFIKSLNKGLILTKVKAAECILEISDFEKYLSSRFESLDLTAKSYLPEGFGKLQNKALKKIKNKYFAGSCSILSPSDIGIHNCIKRDKECIFFDFEYSGLDSPIKLAYDTVLHPANKLDPKFHSHIVSTLFHDLDYKKFKFDSAIYDVFIIWWILRLLNSINEHVINERVKKGTLLFKKIDLYVQHRSRLAERYWSMLSA